ncbi:MAG: hypothetical protein R3A12_19390 [Ignavibacteria bacterium]|nr:hypothetical protein [Ignavibacteriota bacterium]
MKKNLNYFMVLIVILSGIGFSGCTEQLANLSLVTTEKVEIGGKYKKLKSSEGIDKKIWILFIPIGVPNVGRAVEDCIANGNGVLITDAVLTRTSWWFLLYGENDFTIKGDVWGKADVGDLNNPDIEIFELRGNMNDLELVSLTYPDNVVKVSHYIEN